MIQPLAKDQKPSQELSGIVYSNPKLAVLCYTHELQRQVKKGITIVVYEPGFMPGSGLSRGAGSAAASVGRMIGRIPGISTPERSTPNFASVILNDKWSHLHSGAFVVKDKEAEVQAFANDKDREQNYGKPHKGSSRQRHSPVSQIITALYLTAKTG